MQEGSHYKKSNYQSASPKRDVFDEDFINELEEVNTIADYFCVIGPNEGEINALI